MLNFSSHTELYDLMLQDILMKIVSAQIHSKQLSLDFLQIITSFYLALIPFFSDDRVGLGLYLLLSTDGPQETIT